MSMIPVLADEPGVLDTERPAQLGRLGIINVTCSKVPLGRNYRPRQRRSLS